MHHRKAAGHWYKQHRPGCRCLIRAQVSEIFFPQRGRLTLRKKTGILMMLLTLGLCIFKDEHGTLAAHLNGFHSFRTLQGLEAADLLPVRSVLFQ